MAAVFSEVRLETQRWAAFSVCIRWVIELIDATLWCVLLLNATQDELALSIGGLEIVITQQ